MGAAIRQSRWVLAAGAVCVTAAVGVAQTPCGAEDKVPPAGPVIRSPVRPLPLGDIDASYQEKVRRVVRQPTLYSPGPSEAFRGSMSLYRWLLEHPDRGVRAWRHLGAKCLEIKDHGNGRFGWNDGQGTDVHWNAVYRGPDALIWYAEANAKPARLLPTIPIRAVIVLRFGEVSGKDGDKLLYHRSELYVHTDSKTAALVARLLGPSAPKMAEQGLSQMEMFFSALVWYFDRHPEKIEPVLGYLPPLDAPMTKDTPGTKSKGE